MIEALSVVASFSVACFITYLLARPNNRFKILDYPNERSLHTTPTPRTGGLAICAGMLVGVIIANLSLDASPRLMWVAGAALFVAAVSLADDFFSVPVAFRFGAHIVAASVLMAGGLEPSAPWLPRVESELSQPLTLLFGILFVVWMVNLYNFMDGMDGFAGGMAVIGFGSLAALGWLAGNDSFLLLNLIVAAAALGFLAFNFPPARIFMGDVGSSTLGLLAAAFVLWGADERIFPFWVGVLVFSPFIIDATVTLIRRALRREQVWIAHKSHYYQRLVLLGWSHKKVSLSAYCLMVLSGLSALSVTGQRAAVQWAAILVWAVVYTAVIAAIRLKERSVAKR